MNDQEFFDNAYFAILKYLNDNKQVVDDSLFQLQDEGQGVYVARWDYKIPAPTKTQLMSYSVQSLTKFRKFYQARSKITNNVLVDVTTAERDEATLTGRLPNFSTVYNTDAQSLQILVNGQWKSVNLS